MLEPSGLSTSIEVMLPPSVPSERSGPASSLGKRKCGEASVTGSSVLSASSGFAPSVKDRVEQYNGGFQCWNCNAPKSHICHVIGRRERVFLQELQAQGRLSITSVDQAENAMPLCPLCHDALDEISSPGWVFIPTDLQYFLDFEQKDSDRRREIYNSTGTLPVRVSPSAAQYLQHQSGNGVVQEGKYGGLYTCYVLRHYMARIPGYPEIKAGRSPCTAEKSWHGDPNAALSKAFKAVGAKPTAFPPKVRDALLELSLLYGNNDCIPQEQGNRPSKTQPSEQSPENGDSGRPSSRRRQTDDTVGCNGWRTPSPARRLGIGPAGAEGGKNNVSSASLKRKRSPEDKAHMDLRRRACEHSNAHRWMRRSRSVSDMQWKWGPGATSQMAMKFYDAVYHLPIKETIIKDVQGEPGYAESTQLRTMPSLQSLLRQ